MTKYVRNEEGGIHSVTDEHFDNVLHELSEGGRPYLKQGWTEITEQEARNAHPQLFSKADPAITYNPAELAAAIDRKRMLDELHDVGALESGAVEAPAGE